MASSMLTSEVTASGSTEADVDKALKAAFHSCLNDPNFAIICDFLQKFSKDLGLDLPNFRLLLQWLTKTDEVSSQLRDMQIKLLRKTRKTVHEKSWESALSKFCFTYSAQDGWEIERFGYKNSSVKVKLRILRELLEYQFEHNTKFRTKFITLSADSLRSKPIGRDRQGHAYWVTQDNDCNIRIYQEHLDEEIWQIVATNRDEFVNLLKRLRGSEVVLPCNDIGIDDEDTTGSSSSQIESDSVRKVPSPDGDPQEDEQKVPKLSIKLVQGKSSTEITIAKDLGKGEEELAEEEDAKLVKKNNSSDAIESDEGEFDETEYYGDESVSEVESEDDINDDKQNSKKNNTEENVNKYFKSKDENKKVKPLLISQNKVINNENCSTSGNACKKRALDQGELSSLSENENQLVRAQKKYRPSLLDSKHPKSANKYEDNKKLDIEGCEVSANEDVEVEEEVDEEDIDSVAAEEDENEEKLFEDYDDENEEEEVVGKEICDPTIHVAGEGSGKDCDVENYLYCIDYDLGSDNLLTLSNIIVEDVCYFHGEGNGKECLVGNSKHDDEKTNVDEKSSSDNPKTKVKEESKAQSEKYKKTTLILKHTDSPKLSNTSKQSLSNDDSLDNTTNIDQDLDINDKIYDQNSKQTTKKCNEIEKQVNLKEEANQINGEKKSQISSKSETFREKVSNENKADENAPLCDTKKTVDKEVSETLCKEDNKMETNNITLFRATFPAVDMSTKQEDSSKMVVVESLKKELRECKQKLLKKKLPHMTEGSNTKVSSPAIYNRKRRLTDQLQASTARPSNSESEVELNSENTEGYPNEKELDIDESEQDIGGKRLKMRSKQANTELRKKVEAQKVAANEESTSSSSGEEELKKIKKIILSKQHTVPPVLKSGENLKNLKSRADLKHGEDLTEVGDKVRTARLIQRTPPLKQVVQTKPTKIKQTLTEIIENKLKQTPEKLRSNSTPVDIDSNMEEATTTKELFRFPSKSPITKPLKKNLLIQIRQEESEGRAPRKRTNSQDSNTSVLNDTTTIKNSIDTSISKTDIENQKTTPERQRKRRSSEETIQNDNPEEPEAKKEVTVVKENVTLKRDKLTETTRNEIIKEEPKDFKTQKEPSVSAFGRRSGRRGGVVPTYVDTLTSKRNRGPAKTSTKSEFTDCKKTDPMKDQSNSVDVANKSNGDKLSVEKSADENDIKDAEIKKNINLLEIKKINVSKPKSSSPTKTPTKGIRKQRDVDATNIIDIDNETPVRQSRRIAQQKIREEAERRKLEEIALRSMKQELKKKKKAEKQADPTVLPPTEPSSDSEESDVEIRKKVQKKKCPGRNGNWSSGSEEQEEPEEEDEEHHRYETDPGSPLFKSDHEFSPESDIEDELQVVPMKRARTVRKEDAGDEATPEEEEACQKCKKSDHPEWILLCDKCDKGYHCSCLSPVLFYIPEGDWYCPPCQQEQLIKALENQLKEFDDLVENKKKEEFEKRIAEEEKARQEKEEETNKIKTKKDKIISTKRNTNSSTDHSQEEHNDEEPISNSDESVGSETKSQSGKIKNRNTSRNFRNSDKRNHRDRRSNATRSRRNRRQKLGSDSDSDSQDTSNSKSVSNSNSSSSSTYSESDNEPIYKLRKRRQINVSYRLNEYDDLINSALKKEMDGVAGAGNLGRGKDISTIIEADKEEKARQKQIDDGDFVTNHKGEKINENVKETKLDSLNIELNETNKESKKNEVIKQEIDSDAEPIISKLNIKPSLKKKSRKLTTLDISSEDDDGSDEDFKGSSFDDEEEEDTSISASNSDSSLEIYKRHGKFKKKRRKAARKAFRQRRRVRRFLVDESDDEDVQRPKSKKKRKDDSDYTESEADDDDISELSENIDSADLCDDTTTDESDGAWRPNKKKAKKSTIMLAQKSPKSKSSHSKKAKKVEYSDDDVSDSDEDEDDDDNEEVGSGKGMGKQPRSQPLKTNSISSKTKGKGKEKPATKTKKKKQSDDESNESGSEDSTRRTRGRRYAYIEDFDDSSDGGIKPGVQRPDTPPEEREKFIKRQEEIKRMLAEKNAEGAKLVATPRLTPIKTDAEKDKRSPKAGGDSLSTVPLSVIRQAKVLDIDYLQRRGENLDDLSTEVGEVDDDFDDADLPDDLPEDMDEDAIARMVEEEEEFGVTATRDNLTPDEVLRTPATAKPSKPREVEKPLSSSQLAQNNNQVNPVHLPTPTSGLQEPVRKRLPMPTIHPPLLRHQFLMHDSIHNTHHQMQRQGGPHTSHLLQNALSAPLTHHMDRNYPSITSSAPHHSLINRMAHSLPLQPTSSHTLSTARPSHPSPSSINTKSSPLPNQAVQEKSTNPQNVTESKPRGRRKKITPLRDTLQKQQAAAAVTAATASSSALASSLAKNNDPASTSLLSSVIKSGLTQKLIMQASGITNMPPTSHSATSRSGVPMPPVRSPYIRTDGPKFYDAMGNRTSQTSGQRHRAPPQMPPSLLPPHPANRSSYGPPPPLKGLNSGSSGSSSSNTSGSIRNTLHHVPSPYMGMPPNARHASHLNMYSRPPIYGNPNFGPRVNLRPPNIHPPGYSPGSRAYPPYGFYPPPPPLTTPVHRSGLGPVPRPIQMPPVQSTLTRPPPSVIVSVTSAKSSSVPPQPTPSPKSEITGSSSSSKPVVVIQELPMKIPPQKSSSPALGIAKTEKTDKRTLSVAEPRKKLTTLQAYSASTAKKSPTLLASDSSGSRSPHNPPTGINDEASAQGPSENTPAAEQPTRQEGQASEFSGLVSYFSSQHDDYNT